ncbi:DNA polymerase III subunit delta' [Shewanella sp. JM162201]|uniref:DNA-directed DNA polymerase n=1 Tax=Shewanella jiangmenensis TaxID=2837387 RepID=A0ABS5V793_9GAMM|nr:DNA polymerase III subunit delta' [Shewanella jiangmenensis]MBT1445838.1 DNA polymerase III subunit delta' [Shewanella jiangmenensis]
MDLYPWFQPSFDKFLQLSAAGRLPHALLVGIEEGLGVNALLERMAGSALCLSVTPHGACGQCKSCQLLSAGNHPDFYRLVADGNQIKVDQVRSLIADFATTAQQGGKRVALIHGAERMNQAAANALLKTLEEPPANTLILLQSNTPARLLPTLRSRCQQLPFVAPDNHAIAAWLSREGLRADAIWALPVVGGPVKLAEYLQNNKMEVLERYRKDWRSSLSHGHLCASFNDISEEQITDVLKVLYSVLLEAVQELSLGNPIRAAKVAGLAGEIMAVCHTLTTMSSVNYLALCQKFVSSYQGL